MKRLVTTPRGMAELDVAGSERHAFVTITVFGEDGWATDEEMWGSVQEDGLGSFLAQLSDMPTPQADAIAEEFMATWRQRGGAAEGATQTRRFTLAVVGALVAVAVVAVLLTWIFIAAFG